MKSASSLYEPDLSPFTTHVAVFCCCPIILPISYVNDCLSLVTAKDTPSGNFNSAFDSFITYFVSAAFSIFKSTLYISLSQLTVLDVDTIAIIGWSFSNSLASGTGSFAGVCVPDEVDSGSFHSPWKSNALSGVSDIPPPIYCIWRGIGDLANLTVMVNANELILSGSDTSTPASIISCNVILLTSRLPTTILPSSSCRLIFFFSYLSMTTVVSAGKYLS
ncbi:unknown [Eubacterium sp. CAG:603]|nr:unknown [Eubacterium sp. CAG:603]